MKHKKKPTNLKLKKLKKQTQQQVEFTKNKTIDYIVIPTAILKSELTLELVESMVANAKDVEPNYIFNITLFNDAAEGGVIVDKSLHLTFGQLAKANPEQLYHEFRANDSTFASPKLAPVVIDATDRMEKK